MQALLVKLLTPHKLPSNVLLELIAVEDLPTLMPVVLMKRVEGVVLQLPAFPETYWFALNPFHQKKLVPCNPLR